jgi:hypothetical protein
VGKTNFRIERENMVQGTLFIEINSAFLDGDKTKVILEVYNNDKLLDTEATNFLGPRTFN